MKLHIFLSEYLGRGTKFFFRDTGLSNAKCAKLQSLSLTNLSYFRSQMFPFCLRIRGKV